MAETELYEELARHLDQGIIGSPRSPALIGILEVLFPEEEARIAVRLPFMDQTLAQLKELFPEEEDGLEALQVVAQAVRADGEERKTKVAVSRGECDPLALKARTRGRDLDTG